MKNYKELCELLGMEIKKSTNSKKAQLKELERYCELRRDGHKFIITKVYKKPRQKEENRGKSKGSRKNNDIYGNLIQLLILDYIVKGAQKGINPTIITNKNLQKYLNMINSNYTHGNANVKKLAMYTEINEGVIYEFFKINNGNFKSLIETALKSLRDKALLMYKHVLNVQLKDHPIRVANEDEEKIVLECEKQILEEMGYRQISEVMSTSHWNAFKHRVKKLVLFNSDIRFYFFAYHITVNEKYIIQEYEELQKLVLEDVERLKHQTELNRRILKNVEVNATNRQVKTQIDFSFGKREKAGYRLMDSYVDDFKSLANLLINQKTLNFTHELDKVQLKNDHSQTSPINNNTLGIFKNG